MKEHYNDDTDNPLNGSHKTVTIRPGTTAAGTAPLKFTSGSLMTTPEAGAVEFETDSLYFTTTTGTVRKKVATYDDSSGATGDLYYRNSGGDFVRLPAGSDGDSLSISSGLPAWSNLGVSDKVSKSGDTMTGSLTISNAGGKTTLQLTSTGSNTGLTIGNDIELYRSSAGILNLTGAYAASSYITAYNATSSQVAMGRTASGVPGAGITFGSTQDTNIYRSAADVLSTDDSLTIAGSVGIGTTTLASELTISSAAPVVTFTSTNNSSGARLNVTGTATNLFRFQYNGTTMLTVSPTGVLSFGSTADTTLYRSAADTLRTDDNFVASATTTLNTYTGILKGTNGLVSVATSGTDYVGLYEGWIATNPLILSPESSKASALPYFTNDIAYNRFRGGATRVYFDGVLQSGTDANTDKYYTPNSEAYSITSIATVSEIKVEVDCWKTFNYSTKVGYAANELWRAKNVLIEGYALSTGAWVTIANVTNVNYGEQLWNVPSPLNNSSGFNQLRFTFSNFNTFGTYNIFRIAQIFVLGYNSNLGEGPFVSRGGGSVYAQLKTAVNGSSLYLGDGTNADVYQELQGRGFIGYRAADGTVRVQGGSSKGLVLAVNNSTFGSGTNALSIDTAGASSFGGAVGVGTSTYTASSGLNLASGTTSAYGIAFGTDTTLYRNGASSLRIGGALYTDGALVVGDATASTNMFIRGTSYNGVSVDIYSDTASGYSFFRRARGSYATPTYTTSGSYLGSFGFRGHTGSAFVNQDAARFSSVATEDFNAGTHSAYIAFYTAAVGTPTSSGSSERLRIDPSGNLLIGTTTTTSILSLASATTAAGGIAFGTDTVLYRSAADTLKTDDAFTAASLSTSGNITVAGTVDGRDVATDGAKLDTIATNADVTDTASVTSAGALMDSELTDLAGVKALNTSTLTTLTGTQTLTNKRITVRTGTTTSSATPTINTDNVDAYHLTAQAVDITSFTTNLSGTPTDFQKLIISITGTGARAITWGSSFENGPVALPTTTTSTQRLDVGFIWNAVTSKWRCMASGSA